MVRTTATVLFTDLVGSTELAVEHGEAFDDARRAHDAALRAVVAGRDGTVVKGTGDGLLATFDAVADGVAAARGAQQAIHRLNQRRPAPALSIRVGLAVGDVSFEGGDCYGECVVQAARLCSLADGGQILATDLVRALDGGRRSSGYADAGARELKGLPGTVDAVEVEWDRPETSATPLPARLATGTAAFVGRGAELDELSRAYRTASEDRERQIVLVGGEPGVGKTTVVAEAIRRWYDSGATVAMGRCEEDVRAPYGAFVEVLGHLVASAPDDLLRDHVARHGRSLVPLVPGLGGRVDLPPEHTSSDLETERFRLFAAVDDLLRALSERAPLVLFLDDLHWADAGTASLLRSLATAPGPARVIVVGTLRSDELSPSQPMGQAVAAFRRVASVSRLQVDGLDRADVADLVDRWTGAGTGAAVAQLADDLVAETDGNAFFVTEVIRHLEETGRLADLPDRPPVRGSLVPESVREVLGERIARLGSVGDEVLATAAVIGAEFSLPLVAAVAGLDEPKVLGLLTDAASAALVREVADAPGRFAFTHALVQHAIQAGIGTTRTAALHRRVAEVLEAQHEDGMPVGALAHHWLQATNVSDTARARDWALQAGDAALAGLAPGDAVAFYRQALLLHDQLRDDDVAARIDLLTKLGTAERQAGDPEHRDTLLKACRLARRAGDGPRLAAAALANNSGSFSRFQGTDPERLAMLEAAIADAGEPTTRALLLGTLANELTYAGDYARRREIADAALTAARAAGDDAVLLRVLSHVFYALWVPETLDERVALAEETMALAPRVDDPIARYWAASTCSLNLVQAGRVREAEEQLRTMRELADWLAQPALRWRALHSEAAMALLAGDPDRAEPSAVESFELGDGAGAPEANVYFKSQEMVLRWQRGTLEELSARIRGASPRPPNAEASLCLIFSETGRDAEVATVLDRRGVDGFADLPRDPAYVASVAMFSEAAANVGHVASAARLHELLLPFADQIGHDGVMTVGSLEHHLGALARVLGRPDEAVERLRRTAERHAAIGAAFFEARTRCELARALLATDAAAARAEAERSLDLAVGRGYAGVERRVRALLVG
jgi:class 3 adenylate cyclase